MGMSRDRYLVKRTDKNRCHFFRYDHRDQVHAFVSRYNFELFY